MMQNYASGASPPKAAGEQFAEGEAAGARPPLLGEAPIVGSRFRFVLGVCLGLAVRLWVLTYRIRLVAAPEFVGGPAVLSFWHGQQMALLGARRRAGDAAVLVSRSADGDIQSGVMSVLGFRVVRGSSSRGGARALAELVALLRTGSGVALSVDGPRGPLHVAKAGAAAAAKAASVPLVPVASAARSVWALKRAWDAFEIPLPFSRVAIVIGAPLSADDSRARPELLGRALQACRARAEQLVGDGAEPAKVSSEARP